MILGEGLRFGEETYHPDCFNCSQCETPLNQVTNHHYHHHCHHHHDDDDDDNDDAAQGSFHAIKGRPVCGVCNELQFQETCAKCGDTVSGGGNVDNVDKVIILLMFGESTLT